MKGMNKILNEHIAAIQTPVLILKTPIAAISAGLFSWITIEYAPSGMLFFYLLIAMAADFITGLLKSWKNKENTSSEGLRKSITKVTSYFSAVIVIMIMVNVVGLVDEGNKYDLAIIINGLMGFIIFAELYSICENISEVYPESPLVKFVVIPIMTFLRGRFQNVKMPSHEKEQKNTDGPDSYGSFHDAGC